MQAGGFAVAPLGPFHIVSPPGFLIGPTPPELISAWRLHQTKGRPAREQLITTIILGGVFFLVILILLLDDLESLLKHHAKLLVTIRVGGEDDDRLKCILQPLLVELLELILLAA